MGEQQEGGGGVRHHLPQCHAQVWNRARSLMHKYRHSQARRDREEQAVPAGIPQQQGGEVSLVVLTGQ